MKKDDISRLLQHYLSAKEEGKEPYFDADQIDEMLDSFEDSNDYTYFDEVLALGLKLHPRIIPPCKSRKAGNSHITRIMRALSLCSRI